MSRTLSLIESRVVPSRLRLTLVCLAGVLGVGLSWGMVTALAQGSVAAARSNVVLRLGVLNDTPDDLNPFAGQSPAAREICSLNYDLMVGFGAGDFGHPQGARATGLADRWTISDGGRVWTFHIRSGVTWQDGAPLTAHDVAFSYNYVIRNQLSNYAMYVNFVKSVVAPDDNTVVFTCTRPKANMLEAAIPIVPQHVWAALSGDQAASAEPTLPMVGSGPFQLTGYYPHDHADLMANPDYWGGAPKIDEVEFIYYRDSVQLDQDLRSGYLQGAWGLATTQYQDLQSDVSLRVTSCIGPELDELGFNCYTGGPSLGNPVLKDWHFRQALQWGIDHQKLVQIAYGGSAQPATSVLTSHLWSDPDWHWEPPASEKYTFDLAKAGQMLTAAGYPLKNGARLNKQGKPIVLRLWTRAASASSRSAGKLIAGWFGALGLKIKLSAMDDGAIDDGLYNMKGKTFEPDYDMFLWGWGGDPDPNFILSVFTTSQIGTGWSDCAWSDPRYDKLFLQQQTTVDPARRAAIVHKMEQIIYRQSPYIPTAYPEYAEAYNAKGWRGWQFTPGKRGGAFFTSPVMASYLTVHPASVGSAKRAESRRSLPLLPAGLIIALMLSVALIAWLRGRRMR